MKSGRKRLIIVLGWLLLVTVVVLVYNLGWLNPWSGVEEPKLIAPDQLTIDKEKQELRFRGRIQNKEGWVQSLIYAQGYKWFKDKSAIASNVSILELQKAILLCGVKYWKIVKYGQNKGSVEVKVQWVERGKVKEVNALQMIPGEIGEDLPLEQLIFLGFGMSSFDERVLSEDPSAICKGCPLLPLEEEIVEAWFRREPGESGYRLNSKLIPPPGTPVTVIIRNCKETEE